MPARAINAALLAAVAAFILSTAHARTAGELDAEGEREICALPVERLMDESADDRDMRTEPEDVAQARDDVTQCRGSRSATQDRGFQPD